MAKSPDAFRTISEVADWLGIQAHVLRFWESKFTQVKPIKRAGGRRYYRPNDMLLLGGIKQLLHDDGLTIKGVQKILREEGVAHVSKLSQALDDSDVVDAEVVKAADVRKTPQPIDPSESAEVIQLETQTSEAPPATDTKLDELSAAPTYVEQQKQPETIEPKTVETTAPARRPEPQQEMVQPAPSDAVSAEKLDDEFAKTEEAEPEPQVEAPAPQNTPQELPNFLRQSANADLAAPEAAPSDNMPAPQAPQDIQTPAPDLAAEQPEEITDPEDPPIDEVEVAAPPPKPRILDLPAFTPEAEFDAHPAVLTASVKVRHLSAQQAADIAPLLARLSEHHDTMVPPGKRAASAPPA